MNINPSSIKEVFYPVILICSFIFLVLNTADYGHKINNINFSHNISLDQMAKSGDALERDTILEPKSSSDEENLSKWLMRYKSYSVEADEHIVIMALARINPSELQFDPGFYIYGGSFLYPLGLFYFGLEKLGVINISSFDNMLSNPDIFDDIYYYGRLFIIFFVALSAALLFLMCRRIVSLNTSLIYTAIFLLMPATIMFSQIIKPHYYALFWSNLALFYLIKSFSNNKIGWLNGIIIGASIGMCVGASLIYSVFAVFVWMSILVYKKFTDRLKFLVIIPIFSAIIFLIFNPYLLFNPSSSSSDIISLQGWFYFLDKNLFDNLFLYLRNSFSIGFGFAFTILFLYVTLVLIISKEGFLKIIAIASFVFITLLSIITSSLSDWHINVRYSPYFASVSLFLMAYFFNDKKIIPCILLFFTVIQTIPMYIAYLDEDSPIYSTRLNSSNWINSNIPLNSYVCSRGRSIVPYDSPPFDFALYNVNQDQCDYIISLERQSDKLIIYPKYEIIKRFKPRYNLSYIPLVYSHINPQISIYRKYYE